MSTTIKLGALDFELALPDSFAVRRDVWLAAVRNPERAYAAALGVCSKRLERRLRVAGYDLDCSPLAYGGRVIDALHAQGVPMDQVIEGGATAYRLIADTMLTEEEVKAAEGFSDPSAAGSTS